MSWRPASEVHAIERVSITIQLRDIPPPKPLQAVQAIIRKKAAEIGVNEVAFLPPPVQIHFGQASLGGGIQLPSPQVPVGNGGQICRKTVNGVVEEEIICMGSILAFSATKYGRWAPFWDRVEQCLSEAVISLTPVTDISDVKIEYWDRFDMLAESNLGVPTDTLLNPASRLLAPFYAAQKDSLHSHVGFFLSEGNEKRILINANVDIVGNTPGLPPILSQGLSAQARFHTLAGTQFITPDGGFKNWESIKETATKRHILLKGVFGDMIHPTLAAAINLNPEAFAP